MDDINDAISQILNNPERMQQVMEIAKHLMPVQEEDDQTSVSPERMQVIGNILQQTQRADNRQEALVLALRPYLKPGRLTKLEKAMQIAKLSRLAEMALKNEMEQQR